MGKEKKINSKPITNQLSQITPIYALCDFQTLKNKNYSLSEFITLCHNHNVKLIQYRDKINNLNIQIKNLKLLKSLTNIPIIINDKIDLIEYCDGLHLGQEDLKTYADTNQEAVKLIRKEIGHKLLGISTHNIKEIKEANKLDLDYIGLGAYRTTNTKDVSNILGDSISEIAKESLHPVAAIGGVKKYDKIEHISYNAIGSGLFEN